MARRRYFIVVENAFKRDRFAEAVSLATDKPITRHPKVPEWVNVGGTVVAVISRSIYKIKPLPNYPKDNLSLEELPWKPQNFTFEPGDQDRAIIDALIEDITGTLKRLLVDATEARSYSAHALREILYLEKLEYLKIYRPKVAEDFSPDTLANALDSAGEEDCDVTGVVARHLNSKISYTLSVNLSAAVKAKLREANYNLGAHRRINLGMVTTPILLIIGRRMQEHMNCEGEQRWVPMIYAQGKHAPYRFTLDPPPGSDAGHKDVVERLMPVRGAIERGVPIVIEEVHITESLVNPPKPYTLAPLIADVEHELRGALAGWNLEAAKERLEYLAFSLGIISSPWTSHDEYRKLPPDKTAAILEAIGQAIPEVKAVIGLLNVAEGSGTHNGRHGAIAPTPTLAAPVEQADKAIYNLVARRWLANQLGPAKHAKVVIRARIERTPLCATYDEIVEPGWHAAEGVERVVEHARLLKPGMELKVGVKRPTEVTTTKGREIREVTVGYEIDSIVRRPIEPYMTGTLLEDLINLDRLYPPGEHDIYAGTRLASDESLLKNIQSLIDDELLECDRKTGMIRPTLLGAAAIAILPARANPRLTLTYNALVPKVAGDANACKRIEEAFAHDIAAMIDAIREAEPPINYAWTPKDQKKTRAAS